MLNTLIIDGVKYRLWTPPHEDEDFHPIIREHAKEIFGKKSVYLEIGRRPLRSITGIGAIPDGYAIIFSDTPKLYLVEVELSSHPLDRHIVDQLNRFIRGIKNPENRKELTDALDADIRSDPIREAFVKKMIGSKEIYKFLSDLISKSIEILVIVEENTPKVQEACDSVKIEPKVIEFKTFVREDAPKEHAHLFEPLHISSKISEGKKRAPKMIICKVCGETVQSGRGKHFRELHGDKLEKGAVFKLSKWFARPNAKKIE